VGLAALGVEPVGMGRDVAEEMQRAGRPPGSTGGESKRAFAQALRGVKSVEQQTGAPQSVVRPAGVADVPARLATLRELLRLPGLG
jgi:hypothetical protein